MLALIRSTSGSFKPFVSSRVGEIQSNSDPVQWRHIPGDGPMDQSLSDYLNQNGPGKKLHITPKEEEMEYRQEKIIGTVTTPKNGEAINPQRFSSWRRLIRVTALIQRLTRRIRARRSGGQRQNGPLTPSELQEAEKRHRRVYTVECRRKNLTLPPFRRQQRSEQSWR